MSARSSSSSGCTPHGPAESPNSRHYPPAPSADPVLTEMLLGCNGFHILPHRWVTAAPLVQGRTFPIPTSKQLRSQAVEALSLSPGEDSPELSPAWSPTHSTILWYYSSSWFPNRPHRSHPSTGLCQRGYHTENLGSPAARSCDGSRPSGIMGTGTAPATSSPAPEYCTNCLQRCIFGMLSTPQGSPLIPSSS